MRFEVLYAIFGSFIVSAGFVMIVVYSLTNPWWRFHLGRMIVTYAAAEVLMSTLLMMAVVWHFNPHWFRIPWFVLQTVVGSVFWYQTYVIIHLYRKRQTKERS